MIAQCCAAAAAKYAPYKTRRRPRAGLLAPFSPYPATLYHPRQEPRPPNRPPRPARAQAERRHRGHTASAQARPTRPPLQRGRSRPHKEREMTARRDPPSRSRATCRPVASKRAQRRAAQNIARLRRRSVRPDATLGPSHAFAARRQCDREGGTTTATSQRSSLLPCARSLSTRSRDPRRPFLRWAEGA